MLYGEVAEEADRIARRLRAAGVGPDTIVGLYTSRSIETVCAILGILAAGGAVFPLDPVLPPARLRWMLEDTAPAIVLGRDALPETEAAFTGDIGGEQLAYVMYTSGSTGLPKAVANEHRGLVELVRFTRAQMAIGPGDRVLQFASLSFDVSLWEIFCALGSGATLILGDEESLMPGPGLHTLLRDMRITIALLSPSVLRVMRPEGLSSLRIVVTGMEKCGADVARRWATGRRFFNAYGPTECSVYSTIFEVTDPSVGVPPIGKPVPGTDVEIVEGELWIRGIGLARGYINRPDLTATRFVAVDGKPRSYRTGDRARWSGDGDLEFLGRLDTQLKVRGYRIEAGEIEAALESHPDVATSVAVVVDNSEGGATLWACWEPAFRNGEGAIEADLSEYLRTRLPAYMLPQRFMAVDHWPLNTNGKLDRAMVESWCASACEKPSVPTCHAGDDLAWLLARCRGLLGAPELAASDGLLAAGFSSLAFADLLWSIREKFGVTLGYSEAFGARHAAGIYELLCARQPDAMDAATHVATKAGGRDALVSAAQRCFYLLHQRDPRSPGYHIDCRAELLHRYDAEKLTTILQALVHRHELLRTSFHLADGDVVQRLHSTATIEIRRFSCDEPLQLVRSRFVRPFDLEQVPLLRVGVVVRSNEAFLLLLDLAHIVGDARSCELLLAETRRAFDGLELLQPQQTYREYAQWHNACLVRNRHNYVADYWRNELAALPEPLVLPAHLASRGEWDGSTVLAFELGTTRTVQLKRLAAEAEVTRFVLLAAVFTVFLAHLSGRSDLVFATVLDGRRRREHHDVVGPFAQLIPIRARPAHDKSFQQLLCELARTVQLALDHQDFDFDLLREGGGAICNTGFTLQLFHNEWNDHTYARDIPWSVDLNVEACETSGSLQVRLILARPLRASAGGAPLIAAFIDVVDRVIAEPSARLKSLLGHSAQHRRMAFAFDQDAA